MAKPPEQTSFSTLNWAPLEFAHQGAKNDTSAERPEASQPLRKSPAKAVKKETTSPIPQREMQFIETTIVEIQEQPAKEEPKVISVYDLNRWIKKILEGEFPQVWIRGEISNFKAHTSGHYYLSLKDAKAQISAVMFKGFNTHLKFKPEDGMEVLVRGKVTVYEPRGNYQIFIEVMEPVGAGALQKAFEQLKAKLQAEGLFAPERKRVLPPLPKHIAIVTSPTGAAIRDMLNVLSRRHKGARITVVPCKVQGDQAPREIVAAIGLVQKLKDVDVMIVGRGGGSIEDLWSFNDEAVVRAIAASRVPTISAVGHEIDFTIADFVADLRAPTPSAAAELVAKNAEDLQERILGMRRSLQVLLGKRLQLWKQQLLGLARALVDPVRLLQDLAQRNDDLYARLELSTQRYISDRQMQVELLTEKLGAPDTRLRHEQARLKNLLTQLRTHTLAKYRNHRQELERYFAVLDSLSPLRVVERGYSLVTAGTEIVKNSEQLKVGQKIHVRFAHGAAEAEIKNIMNDGGPNGL